MKRDFFRESGRRGGRKRARSLTSLRRSEIASRAAGVRWGKTAVLMKSVRFDAPRIDDAAYLEEVLLDGSPDDWERIYEEISDHPFGAVAGSLERVLSSTRHYGITPLWSGILRTVRGAP